MIRVMGLWLWVPDCSFGLVCICQAGRLPHQAEFSPSSRRSPKSDGILSHGRLRSRVSLLYRLLILLLMGQFLKSRVVSTVENTKVFNLSMLLSLLLLRTRLPPPSLMLDGCPVFHSLLCHVFPRCMRLSEDLIVMFRDTRCLYQQTV